MTARIGRSRFIGAAGLLALAVFLLGPATASAIFPPVYHNPAPTPTPTPTVPSDPVVTGGGGATPPPVTPPTHSTPEPATLITGLIGLLGGGYILRRQKKSS
jgi:hypothetical protein